MTNPDGLIDPNSFGQMRPMPAAQAQALIDRLKETFTKTYGTPVVITTGSQQLGKTALLAGLSKQITRDELLIIPKELDHDSILTAYPCGPFFMGDIDRSPLCGELLMEPLTRESPLTFSRLKSRDVAQAPKWGAVFIDDSSSLFETYQKAKRKLKPVKRATRRARKAAENKHVRNGFKRSEAKRMVATPTLAVVNAAPRNILPGTSAGGTDHRYESKKDHHEHWK